jgi:uncharacterized protein (DUF736 family)
MAGQYDNTNSGVLFANDKKGNDKAPDRTGTINVEGTEYKIAGWIRKDRNGKQFLSLKVTPPDSQYEAPRQTRRQQPQDEEIPF